MNSVTRFFWFTFGLLNLIIGIVGIIVPLLPTTPFILLAAFAFGKSSPVFRKKLIENKIFGPIILDWEQHRRIRRIVKMRASVVIFISAAVTFSIIELSIFRAAVISSILLAVSAFIWLQKE